MKITLKYFGQLVDVFGNHEEQRTIKFATTTELLKHLKENNAISHIPFQLAINQKLLDNEDSVELNEGDVVALLPPFAGG